ncbi:glycosyl transferase family 9 [Methylocella silvestris BL2]|uniref:Glycosyl transferase family 9 n=1 Tax=Methylocella silvestris (strain DSM 15510 / CIP 108128 / LMG 27833 / NCIMB 13906 / BL2) TaxID=395965 RepID=B8EK09_METSB|nr:glycosyltransferase family 9 protein [Methylocella silvestris]ACK49956.1 glycosyl transferase family 9 [Methylocella silvestris BL2]
MPNQVDALNKVTVDDAGLLKTYQEQDEPDAAAAGQDASKARRRILIYRIGSLGDTVVALPCFHKLAEAFPDAERYVLTNVPVSKKAAALELILGGSGLIHGVVDYPIKTRSIREMWKLSRRLKALEATTLVYLTPRLNRLLVIRDILFFRFSGIKRIIGAPLAPDVQILIHDAEGFGAMESVRLARTLRELGPIDLDDRKNWDLKVTDVEKEAGEAALAPFGGGRFIGVNMGGKSAANHWGEENWRRLLKDLALTHGGYGLLFLGAADEAGAVEKVTPGWPGMIVNACGQLAPRESAAALARASLFVGHDSGPMHLAAAMGVTCVAPFGALNRPRRWHPYGPNHRIIHRLDGIDKVRVEEMAHEVRDVLPGLAAGGPNAGT